MNENEKVAIFAPYLEKFETDHMKQYCADMIKLIPDYIFDMPSSTSGKYHNATQCQPHGQIYHIVMFASIMNYRLNLECNKDKFKYPEQRDAMRCVPIFHDAIKCGWNGSKFTVHEHPMLAGEWVRNTVVEHDIDQKVKEAIARMCERHSGEWTTSTRCDVVLPKPENAMEVFIHECDILSSRSDIDMQIPDYLKAIFDQATPQQLPDINTYKLTFGKWAGRTLVEVNELAPDYVAWAKDNITKEPVRSLLKQL